MPASFTSITNTLATRIARKPYPDLHDQQAYSKASNAYHNAIQEQLYGTTEYEQHRILERCNAQLDDCLQRLREVTKLYKES